MKTITIKTDGISDRQKASLKFQATYNGMLAQLNAPGFAEVLCAHEAAHAYFFTVAGMKEYEAHPAFITYDPSTDDYVGNLAGIQVLDLPLYKPGQFANWFTAVACAHAAGGVVARKLMPSSDGGDEDDRDRFKKMCDGFNKDPNVHIDFESSWKGAQKLVSEMIANPAVMADIKKIAADLRPQFGL